MVEGRRVGDNGSTRYKAVEDLLLKRFRSVYEVNFVMETDTPDNEVHSPTKSSNRTEGAWPHWVMCKNRQRRILHGRLSERGNQSAIAW